MSNFADKSISRFLCVFNIILYTYILYTKNNLRDRPMFLLIVIFLNASTIYLEGQDSNRNLLLNEYHTPSQNLELKKNT